MKSFVLFKVWKAHDKGELIMSKLKVGIIGLGDIAQKAYLPILATKEGIELVLTTRNQQVLDVLGEKYRIPQRVATVDELIETNIDAAFVHAATAVHVPIVEQLIRQHIPVYVDKPLAYSYEEALQLVQLAEQEQVPLMVGFNRRFAPMYQKVKRDQSKIILMQKNRVQKPGAIRTFIFDDFVHVVDTLRYLIPGPIEDIHAEGFKDNGLLSHVVLTLSGSGFTAIGIMNWDSGKTEEIVEVMDSGNKWVVNNLVELTHYNAGEEKRTTFKDWQTTLYRRGFPQIIDHFFDSVKHGVSQSPSAGDSLKTHQICEQIVLQIEQ